MRKAVRQRRHGRIVRHRAGREEIWPAGRDAVGRVHYGGIRIIGTTGSNVADALAAIPATAEIRPNDKINIIGAAGPMGTMHVIRDLCQGVPGVTIFAGDLSDERLAALRKLAEPLAQKNKLTLKTYNPSKDKLTEKFNYIVLMAPVPALVAQAVKDAAPQAPSSTSSPAFPPTRPARLTSTPISRNNVISSAPAARRSTT